MVAFINSKRWLIILSHLPAPFWAQPWSPRRWGSWYRDYSCFRPPLPQIPSTYAHSPFYPSGRGKVRGNPCIRGKNAVRQRHNGMQVEFLKQFLRSLRGLFILREIRKYSLLLLSPKRWIREYDIHSILIFASPPVIDPFCKTSKSSALLHFFPRCSNISTRKPPVPAAWSFATSPILGSVTSTMNLITGLGV